MTANQSDISLREAFDKHLNVRSHSRSVRTLLTNKRRTIDFEPYYQRHYVWDRAKATYFIESILLGIEVPPLILFVSASDNKKYEVIDGRQRFETLKLFFEDKLSLSRAGLKELTAINNQKFSDLDQYLRDAFESTTLRIIEFSIRDQHPHQALLEDRIKKEIFFRYNSGITPLKNNEVDRAKHLEDGFTGVMNEAFNNNESWLKDFHNLFFANSVSTVPHATYQKKIRELMVMEFFPINIYSTTPKRRELIEWLYTTNIEESDEQFHLFEAFQLKITFLKQLSILLKQDEWVLYQSLYWLLVIMEKNDIDIYRFFDDQVKNDLVVAINQQLELFIGLERSFTKDTKARFDYLAQWCNRWLAKLNYDSINFDIYLSGSLNKEEQRTEEVKNAVAQLDEMRLTRPDAVTLTVEDLKDELNSKPFRIRPSYQRQEVINVKKAAGIIESILLGIPLPTIFVYRRKNAISEVVDGQQRILSILGYIGEEYRNEDGRQERSKKHDFSLSRSLRVMTEISGKKYQDLSVELQDRILDFELSVVYIGEEQNTEFDPIELFVRLNSKPYPIRDDSFEMWNSYVDRAIVSKITELTAANHDWFHFRKDNRRMLDEELMTILAFLAYRGRTSVDDMYNALTVHSWAPKQITFTLRNILITEWLMKATNSQTANEREQILSCIVEVEVFVEKVKLLVSAIADEQKLPMFNSFNHILGLKSNKRLQRLFYMLWLILYRLDIELIRQQPLVMAQQVGEFLQQSKTIKKVEEHSLKQEFRFKVEKFCREILTD